MMTLLKHGDLCMMFSLLIFLGALANVQFFYFIGWHLIRALKKNILHVRSELSRL